MQSETMVSDTAAMSSSKNAGHLLTDVFSSKIEQTPIQEMTGGQIINSASVVSNGTTIGQVESGVKVVNEGGQVTPFMNRAKSQELKKRDKGERVSTAPYSEDQNDIRLGQCPQSKVSSYHNNK